MDQRGFFHVQMPVYRMSRPLGLAPFTIDLKAPIESWVTLSYPWLVYSVAFYLGYQFCFFVCIRLSWEIPMEKNYPAISVVGHLLQSVMGFAIFNSCYILNFLRAKQTSHVGMGISEVDQELRKLAHPCTEIINQKNARRLRELLFIVLVLFFSFMTVFDFFVFQHLYGNYMILMCVAYILPYFSGSVVMLQFLNQVQLTKERFTIINILLRHILITNQSSQGAKVIKTTVTATNAVDDKKKSKKFTLIHDLDHLHPDMHEQLHVIFGLHDKLFEMMDGINANFSLQLVVATTSIFTLLIFGLFFEIKVVAWATGDTLKLVLMSSSYLLWSLSSAGMVYLVLFTCSTTKDVANEAGRIVHKILQQKPAFMMTDEIFYSKMKAFNQTLLHRRNLAYFSGLGLFRLDYTFIFSAVAAGTSYLIVLLQFDMSAELEALSRSHLN